MLHIVIVAFLFPRLVRFVFSFFPGKTNFEHGHETAFAENSCNGIFRAKNVHYVSCIMYKF